MLPYFLLLNHSIVSLSREKGGQTEPYKTQHPMKNFAPELEMMPENNTQCDMIFDNPNRCLTRIL